MIFSTLSLIRALRKKVSSESTEAGGQYQDRLLQVAVADSRSEEGLDDLLVQVGAQRGQPIELHLLRDQKPVS